MPFDSISIMSPTKNAREDTYLCTPNVPCPEGGVHSFQHGAGISPAEEFHLANILGNIFFKKSGLVELVEHTEGAIPDE